MLRGVVYMMKRIGLRAEPWDTPRERDDVIPEAMTEKYRDYK